MRASAVPTGVGVATPGLPATTLVETPALFREWSLPSWGSGPWRQSRWLLRSGRGDVGEPVQPWAVWVPGTVRLRVVVLQAELATGDCPCPTCKSLTIQAGIWHRPVQIPAGQCLTPELAVVGHPPTRLVVPFCPHYRGLVGK